MADESPMDLKDIRLLAKRELVDIVNIKCMKAGGISTALQIDRAATAARINAVAG